MRHKKPPMVLLALTLFSISRLSAVPLALADNDGTDNVEHDFKEADRLASLLAKSPTIKLTTDPIDLLGPCTSGLMFKSCNLLVERDLLTADSVDTKHIDSDFWNGKSTVSVTYKAWHLPFNYHLSVNGAACALPATAAQEAVATVECLLPVDAGPSLSISFTIETDQAGYAHLPNAANITMTSMILNLSDDILIDKLATLAKNATRNLDADIATYLKMQSVAALQSKSQNDLDTVWQQLTADRDYIPAAHTDASGALECPLFAPVSHKPSHTAAECNTILEIENIRDQTGPTFSAEDVTTALTDLQTRASTITTVIQAFTKKGQTIPTEWAAYIASLKKAKVVP